MQYYIKNINVHIGNTLVLTIDSYSASFKECTNEKTIIFGEITYSFQVCLERTDIFFCNNGDDVPIKLFENNEYQFKFYNVTNLVYNEELIASLFPKHHTISNTLVCSYSSNNYVGILNLESLGILNNLIEIESQKIDYKDEFSKLLDILTEEVLDLISRDTSFHQNRISKSSVVNKEINNLYSTFAYIKGFLLFDKMPMYLSYLMSKPHKTTDTIMEEYNIWEIDDYDLDQFLNAYSEKSNLIHIDKSRTGLIAETIPLLMRSNAHTDTIDNFENRFVKYTVELIYNYLLGLQETNLSKKLQWEVEHAKSIVSQYLDTPFFRGLSTLKQFSLNSKALQRKYPYNKFLKFYFSLDMASVISLDLSDERACMGQKDVPTMYEYYCFIQFIKAFDTKYTRKNFEDNNLLVYQNSSLNFKLKSGFQSCIEYKIHDEYLLKLYYNKTYNSDNYIVAGRSYSNPLKPDISLELFATDKLLGILHFDAKYKLTDKDSFKIEDIDKMHTYKDAIFGTLASYVLYPGSRAEIFMQEEKGFVSDKYLPAIGACPLSISGSNSNNEIMYIFKIIEQFLSITNEYKDGVFSLVPIKYNGIERILGKKENIIEHV